MVKGEKRKGKERNKEPKDKKELLAASGSMWRKSSGREHGKSEKEVVVIAVSVFTLFLFFICEINDASPDFDFFFFPF